MASTKDIGAGTAAATAAAAGAGLLHQFVTFADGEATAAEAEAAGCVGMDVASSLKCIVEAMLASGPP